MIASAWAVVPVRLAMEQASAARTAVPSATETLRNRMVDELSRSASLSTSLQAPAYAAEGPVEGIEIVLDQMVTEQPQGEHTLYSLDCSGYWTLYSRIYTDTSRGAVVEMVREPGTNTVWLTNPISQWECPGWYKGTISDDGSEIRFSGAQHVLTADIDNAGHDIDYYLVPMEYRITNAEEKKGWFFPTADMEIVLRKDDDGHFRSVSNGIYGLCSLNSQTQAWVWKGFGDFNINMSEFNLEPVAAPEGLETEKWCEKYLGFGHFVEVGFKDEKLYVKGLMPENPDCWSVGTVKGDKVEFEAGQYIGISSDKHFSFLYGGRLEQKFDEDRNQYVDVVRATGPLTFSYNAAGKRLDCTDGAVLTNKRAASDDDLPSTTVKSYIMQPWMAFLVRDPKAAPAAPMGISCYPYDDVYGYGYVDFTFLNEDVNGYLLEPENLYYRIYMNGRAFEFLPDEYMSIPTATTYIPYLFSDYFDFDAANYSHTFYYYADRLDYIGIQTVYDSMETSSLLASPIVTFQVEKNGINGVKADEAKEVASKQTFDLQGRPVVNPAEGSMCIERTVYTDGTSSVKKIIIR